MCRSCDQTPDGAGRRCPSRVDGFTTHESDQRTRSRGMNAAQNSLANGQNQAAADALARAVAAQREMDGINTGLPGRPTVPEGPYRDAFVSQRDLSRARALLDNLNASRSRAGQEPLVVEMTAQRKSHPTDYMLSQERIRIRITGDSEDALNSLDLPSSPDDAEVVIKTREALEAAHAIARISGGYKSKAEGGDASTAAMLDAYIADGPDGTLRASVDPTAEDRRAAHQTLAWAKSEHPTSDYLRSVQATLASPTLTQRQLALAVSAIPVAQRYAARRQATAPVAPPPGGATVPSTAPSTSPGTAPANAPGNAPAGGGVATATQAPPRRSVWLGRVGDRVYTTGTVEKVQPITLPTQPNQPRYLVMLRTDRGASVKWFAPGHTGLRTRDRITLTGNVAEHTEFNGERQTVFNYCDPPVLHNRPGD